MKVNLKKITITSSLLVLAIGAGAGIGIGFYVIFNHRKSSNSIDYYLKKANKKFLENTQKVTIDDNKDVIKSFYLDKFTIEDPTSIQDWKNDKDLFVKYSETEYGFPLLNHKIDLSLLNDLITKNPDTDKERNVIYSSLMKSDFGILLSQTLTNDAINILEKIPYVGPQLLPYIPKPEDGGLYKLFWENFSKLYGYIKGYISEPIEINFPSVSDGNSLVSYLDNSIMNNLISESFVEDIEGSSLTVLNNFQLPFPDMQIKGLILPITGAFINSLIKTYGEFGIKFTYDIKSNSIDWKNLGYSIQINK